jgi:hypothetical protein
MGELVTSSRRNDDPLKLREILGKASSLASEHALTSVVVGMAGIEGDLVFPEVVDFFESALRVDDAVFRMTRERAVLLLADVSRDRAEEIVRRLMGDFRETFAPVSPPEIRFGFYEVTPGDGAVTVKQVLPALFAPTAAN